jgi:glycogen debranching enzyme
VSEVADGDAPHRPGGCPFQAWSLGELIRIEAMLGAPDAD